MKTIKLALGMGAMLVLFGSIPSMAQWATSGTNIYNTNSGNVGIGNNSPTTLLYVAKNMTEPTITVRNLGGIGGATYQMYDNASGADWKFKATNSGGFKIRDHAYSMDVLTIEANSEANSLYINSLGYVGMGTTTPADNLHIRGASYPFIFLDDTFTSPGNMGLAFQRNGSFRGWIYFRGSSDGLVLNAEAGGGSRNDIFIKSDGRVGIGTVNVATGYALSIAGKAVCTEVLVDAIADWPDYVFSEDYSLMCLTELEQSIKENNHLPGIPSAREAEENGILLGEMQKKLLEKVEELTLYTIEQHKHIAELQAKVEKLEGRKPGKNRK